MAKSVRSRRKQRDPIPDSFSSVEEAAEFWEAHSIADYWDQIVLAETGGSRTQPIGTVCAVESRPCAVINQRALSATEAIERFYHADNCLYVRKHLRNPQANSIMSQGVQLPDLFECLPPEEAQREFYHELETMRALCLKLLERRRTSGVLIAQPLRA